GQVEQFGGFHRLGSGIWRTLLKHASITALNHATDFAEGGSPLIRIQTLIIALGVAPVSTLSIRIPSSPNTDGTAGSRTGAEDPLSRRPARAGARLRVRARTTARPA